MLTTSLADHISTATSRPLPAEVVAKTKLHVLDTVAAMVSGTDLRAGRKAIPFVLSQGGREEATLFGAGRRTTALLAALANGMTAHADETDDSHAQSFTHPGCAVVPAALAAAERDGRSGEDLLRAVAVGYDVGPRVSMALGAGRFYDLHHSSHSVGGLFGAVAAASSLTCRNADQAGAALSYAVQLASGNACWRRDADHVEKAFDFGGMPAQNGMLSALFAGSGFTGSTDPLEGTPGLFAAFPHEARPELAAADLGEVFEIMNTAIKKWCVGSPIQAALDSLQHLMNEEGVTADAVERIVIDLPLLTSPIVDNRDMPDVCLQHLLGLLLTDGDVTFHAAHDYERMRDPAILALRERMELRPRAEQEFIDRPRQGIVTVATRDGRELNHRTVHVRGTPGNPMTDDEVVAKAVQLLEPVLESRTNEAVETILSLETVSSVPALCELLRGDPGRLEASTVA